MNVIFRLLRLRYVIAGGAVGGGAYIHQRYQDVKDALPDFSPILEYVPDRESVSKLFSAFNNVSLPSMHIRLPEPGDGGAIDSIRDKMSKLQAATSSWLSAVMSGNSDRALPGVEDLDTAKGVSANFGESVLSPKFNAIMKFASVRADQRRDDRDAASKTNNATQEDVMGIQVRYQREIDRLERENRELRRETIMLANKESGSGASGADVKGRRRGVRKPLIDMYSEVLDDLLEFEQLGSQYSMHDHLPRVVVVGDQSSGKTSVLEVIAKARIFPRGSGEMMTRTPVKVTLSEGPYHIAFFKDSPREFDLSREDELSALRKEIEIRMKANIPQGETVSSECISLTVKGPGLPRMVLIDLPGVINSETYGMAGGTRDKIQNICKQYLENPSAIILCVQDGSVDAERNAVTDLVAAADGDGKRTIFVMTKADLAESTFANTNRISQILEGRLFQLRALGYFAVVTGKGNVPATIREIQDYEQNFFTNSNLFRQGIVKPSQLTTHNLALAVSDCFWRMVRESSAQQSDALRALRYNLETEWKNSFGRYRQLERAELFDRARADILDELAALSMLPPRHWHDVLATQLWQRLAPTIIDNVLLPAAESANQFDTIVDVRLRQWADSGELPRACVSAGLETLRDAAFQALDPSRASDSVYATVRQSVQTETVQKHNWDSKAEEALRIIQRTALDDIAVHTKVQWQAAVDLLRKAIKGVESDASSKLSQLAGPSSMDQWVRWRPRPSEEQNDAKTLTNEIERMLVAVRDRDWNGVSSRSKDAGLLSSDDLTAARRSAESQCGHVITKDVFQQVWTNVRRRELARRLLAEADLCEKAFQLYQHERSAAAGPLMVSKASGLSADRSCSSVVLFHRLYRMLDATAMALRQQLSSAELRRLEAEAREDLDNIADDRKRLNELLSGRRVELAEELKCVRHMQDRLEEFLAALSQESALSAGLPSSDTFAKLPPSGFNAKDERTSQKASSR